MLSVEKEKTFKDGNEFAYTMEEINYKPDIVDFDPEKLDQLIFKSKDLNINIPKKEIDIIDKMTL